jgi:hypothetical protein
MSLEEGYVKIENNNYDIDSLFNFHFQSNFDQLKFVIMALATAQKKTNDRVTKLESTPIEIPKQILHNLSPTKLLVNENIEEDINENNHNNDQYYDDMENNYQENELEKSPGRMTMRNSMISGADNISENMIMVKDYSIN